MFLKNKNIIFKIRRSKVTDYAALIHEFVRKTRLLIAYDRAFYVLIYVRCIYLMSLSNHVASSSDITPCIKFVVT